jgi:hypothetical protein
LSFNTNEPIDYDGKFYRICNGGISTPAFTEGGTMSGVIWSTIFMASS